MPPSLGSSLDLSLEYRSYTRLSSTPVLRSPSVSEDGEETVNFEDYVKRLEEERLKIEAFKRELPFSVQLVNDVIEASRRLQENYESEKHQMEEGRNGLKPAIEEFVSANKISEEAEGNKLKVTASYAKDDMPNWMSSVELWSRSDESKQATVLQRDSHPQQTSPLNPTKNLLGSKNRESGAFLPFSKEMKQNLRCTDLRLSSDGDEVCSCPSTCNTLVNFYNNEDDDEGSMYTAEAQDERTLTRTKSTDRGNNTNPTPNTPPTHFHSSQRKARRSWSLELHQKFVKALQQLGGAQATPKQIKEVMNVDGLTNDEVKSHLQKYRLQTRKPSCEGSQSCVSTQQSSAAPPLLVVGGIWVPPEYVKHQIPPSMTVYTPLPNQSHGRYYYQQPPPPIGVDHFYSERNASSS